jgi:hypothetical protein
MASTMAERLVYAVICLIVRYSEQWVATVGLIFVQGRKVQVTLQSGIVWEGLLHSASADTGFSLVLFMATKRSSDSATVETRPLDVVLIPGAELSQILATDVVLLSDPVPSASGAADPRRLERWQAGEGAGDAAGLECVRCFL